MNDPELFELCKELFAITDWKGTDAVWYSSAGEVRDRRQIWYHKDVFDKPDNVPLYTADFLLERLPFIRLESGRNVGTGELYYVATGPRGIEIGQVASPLKALLKLTLALHEAGELEPQR